MLLGALLLLGFGAVTLRSSQRELKDAALRDSLTGMPNRRSLMTDLEQCMRDASPERPLLLALFDLDGFKAYNDSFGHPVGDTLLVRLGGNLSAAVSAVGSAYRMGGDEFCVLAKIDGGRPDMILEAAGDALSEHGTAFNISASYGSVLLPTETTTSPRLCASPTSACTRARARAAHPRAGRARRAAAHARGARSRPGSAPDRGHGLCQRTASRLGVPEEEHDGCSRRRPLCTTSASPRSRTRS